MNSNTMKLLKMKTEAWFNLDSAESDDTATLRLYGVIGGDWFDDGTNAKDVSEQLEKLNAKTLEVKINSPGGSVWDGWAIYNSILAWGFGGSNREVVIYVDGCAGSIASVIAMAGERIIMPVASQMFIHNPWTIAAGNANHLDEVSRNLRDLGATIRRIYSARTGQPENVIQELMDGAEDGTFLSAERALELGFCTEVRENIRAAACGGVEILGKIAGNVDTARIDAQNIVNAIYRNTKILTTKG